MPLHPICAWLQRNVTESTCEVAVNGTVTQIGSPTANFGLLVALQSSSMSRTSNRSEIFPAVPKMLPSLNDSHALTSFRVVQFGPSAPEPTCLQPGSDVCRLKKFAPLFS